MGAKEGFYYYITALNPGVTGSCYLVVIHYPDGRVTMFVVDCGLFQERDYDELNNMNLPFDSANIEFVLITHNHADHIGRLPMLVKGGFTGKIYATESTVIPMQPAIQNSYQIMKENAKNLGKKPLYEEEDANTVFTYTVPCELEEMVYVDKNIKVCFFDNGHLPGAAMILVQISYPGWKTINLFFTGDYKARSSFKTVRKLPSWVLELPLSVVVESTYGYMDSVEIDYHFENDVVRVLRQGKSLLTFVFAQERAQEILYVLKKMQERGLISKSIRIYLDGNLGQVYTNMYTSGKITIDEDKRNFLPENFDFVTKDNRQAVLADNSQKIILTTSGMADHGPAQIYVPHYISRRDFAFYFTGYIAEGTFGYKLKNPEGGMVDIQGQKQKVKAEILWTGEFSSHAKADELEELLRSFKDLKLVLVNHGQKEVKEQFARRLEEAKVAKRVEILGEHTVMASHYGCIKIMGAKLYCISKVAPKKEKNHKDRLNTRRNQNKYRVCFRH